jgi:hypothetical protein
LNIALILILSKMNKSAFGRFDHRVNLMRYE